MESTLQLNNETFFVVYLQQGEHFYIQRTTEQYAHNWPQKFLIAVIVAMQFTLHAFVPKNKNIGSSYKGNQDFGVNHSGLYN